MYLFNDYSDRGYYCMAKKMARELSSVHAICLSTNGFSNGTIRIPSISERPTDFSEAVPEGSLIS